MNTLTSHTQVGKGGKGFHCSAVSGRQREGNTHVDRKHTKENKKLKIISAVTNEDKRKWMLGMMKIMMAMDEDSSSMLVIPMLVTVTMKMMMVMTGKMMTMKMTLMVIVMMGKMMTIMTTMMLMIMMVMLMILLMTC